MPNKRRGLIQQIEKIIADRSLLRSGISAIVAIAGDIPDAIKPSLVQELRKLLDKTADEEDA